MATAPPSDLVPRFSVATPTELFISEYIEGSSNNKAIEIYNGTGAPIDLGTGGYTLAMAFNGATTFGLTINLTGTVADGDVFVIAQSSADAAILAQADQTNGAGWFNGDDAVVLRKGTAVVDAIGQVGFDPGTEWGSGLVSTADNTLRRKPSVCMGDTDATNAFDPSIQWDGYATNTFDGLGTHSATCVDEAPAVASTTPADGAVNVPVTSDIGVTFSEAVALSGSWFAISCTLSGAHTAAASGGPATYTLDPDADFAAGETCTVTIVAAQVTDQDTDDPPDNMVADHVFDFSTLPDLCTASYTPIGTIQGTGSITPLDGAAVVTRGVVIGDYEGPSPELRGFYIQDPVGDADPMTSEGLFVFNGNANVVALGDEVGVSGTAGEFQDQTQISNAVVAICGTGNTVTPAAIALPVPAADYLERFEGMLVHMPQSLYVTEHFQLGRFGQVVLSSTDRLYQPTSVAAPGAPALAVQAANDLNRIILDDAANGQNPDPILIGGLGSPLTAANTLRGGDQISGIVGVLTYTWAGNSASGNGWRVRPAGAQGGALTVTPANPRPTSPDPVGGSVRVGSFNVLNYFNTFSGCTNGVGGSPTTCRGAANATEFDRQVDKTIAAIAGLNVDVLGILEIENDGYDAASAIADLVNRLNSATAPGTWAYLDVDAATGQLNALGLDAIKSGVLYKPSVVTPVGTTAVLNSTAFVNGGDAELRNRPSLLQAFQRVADGARFLVNVNHLKSKGSPCSVPDSGDGQGECNAVRTSAANQLLDWFLLDPTGTAEDDVLILGDLNSYAMEDPITALTGGGFVNLLSTLLGPTAYAYVFDGQWGYLDHALASSSLSSQVTGVTAWHINADEPLVLDYNVEFKSLSQLTSLYSPDAFRSSDHDPLIVGLNLASPTAAYDFSGFVAPIMSPPVFNRARAGQSVPIKFGLGGDQGLDVLEPGYPKSRAVDCGSAVPLGAMTTIEIPGSSGLSYSIADDLYTIVWKTERAWGGTCRELVVKLADGSVHRALFELRR